MTTLSPPALPTGTYEVDAGRSRVGFAVRSLAMKVKGSFAVREGQGHFDADDPARSTMALRLGASTIDTGNKRRDAHLRSDAFLAAEAHPDITFTSSEVKPLGTERFVVTGDLTVRGVPRPVTVELRLTRAVTDADGETEVTFDATTVVRRSWWGVRWSPVLEGGGVLIGDSVQVWLTMAARRRAA